MSRQGSLARISAWLALISLVVAALMPAIAIASDIGHSRNEAALCSVITPGAPTNDGSSAPAAHAGHCTWCSIHCDALALPPDFAGLDRVDAGVDQPPGQTRATPPLSTTWPSGQPRAPPNPS
jgi:hypothetical protein